MFVSTSAFSRMLLFIPSPTPPSMYITRLHAFAYQSLIV
jgi:hypothetical protein